MKIVKYLITLLILSNSIQTYSMWDNLKQFFIPSVLEKELICLMLGQKLTDAKKSRAKELINFKINLDKVDHLYGNALTHACKHHPDIAKLLIEKGANVNIQETDLYQYFPLLSAAASKNEEIVKLLIKKGADVNKKSLNNSTALHMAFRMENIKIVKMLLKAGANIDSKTKKINTDYQSFQDEIHGNTSLNENINYGNIKIIKLLLKNGANPNTINDYANTPLISMLYENPRMKVLKLLIKYGANINIKNKSGRTAYYLTEKHKPKFFNKLIKITNYWKSKVYQAIEDNNLADLKKYILKIGTICFKDENGNNLLHIAIQKNNIELAKLILSIRPDFIAEYNTQGQLPLNLISNQLGFDFIQDLLTINLEHKRKRSNDIEEVTKTLKKLKINEKL